MKNTVIPTISLLAFCLSAAPGFSESDNGKKIDGARGFARYCAACHPDGGNIISKSKTLRKSELAASGIKDWQDIVKVMRNPGPGMKRFDAKTISDRDAKAIAEHILETYK